MTVAWSTAPSGWPSTTDIVTLEKARIALASLRVVGDAGPGDPRTTSTGLNLRWEKDVAPDSITFDNAPTGLYSQVAIVLDGGSNDTYSIDGRVDLGSDTRDFHIDDSAPLTFNVSIDKMVNPGANVVIPLRINFTHALDVIDWSNVDISDGKLDLSSGDSQMPAFRAKLIESFEIVSGGSGAR